MAPIGGGISGSVDGCASAAELFRLGILLNWLFCRVVEQTRDRVETANRESEGGFDTERARKVVLIKSLPRA